MAAAKHTLIIEAKADFTRSVGLYLDVASQSPADLTGCTASASIKVHATDDAPLVVFVCDIPNPASGVIQLSLAAAETAKLQKTSKAMWDLLLTLSDGSKRRVVDGPVLVSPGVTS
jgi:hypothetical protein